MDESPSAGWYADPAGTPDSVRWWHGSGWTEHRRQGPGTVAPPRTEGRGEAGDDRRYQRRHGIPRARSGKSATGWVLGGVGTLLLIFVAAAASIRVLGHGTVPLVGSSAASDRRSDLGNGSIASDSGRRIVDPAAGLSYARPRAARHPWKQVAPSLVSDQIDWTHAIGMTVQPNFDHHQHNWSADVYTGVLGPTAHHTGLRQLRATTVKLTVQIARNLYQTHRKAYRLRSRPLTVDGRRAWAVNFVYYYPNAAAQGWQFRTESVAVLVIDRGSRPASVFYASIPHARGATSLIGLVRSIKVS